MKYVPLLCSQCKTEIAYIEGDTEEGPLYIECIVCKECKNK